MASILSAGTTSATAMVHTADTSGVLQLATNNGTAALTLDTAQNATFAGYANMPNTFGFKNRIINGAMVINQRALGTVTIPATTDTYTLDRWKCYASQASKYTVQQSSTAPTGFINSALITSSSAYSVGAGEEFDFIQVVEGLNCTDLAWGTASAKTVTLSAWVYSSLTGTFGGSLRNSAANRSYPFSYTIPVANTWTNISVIIAGDTSGTWLTTSGAGIYVNFSMGAGSSMSNTAGAWVAGNYTSATGATSVVGTNGATFYITGVQLEKGSTATSFDYRPYGTELQLCQRYYEKFSAQIAPSAYVSVRTGAFYGYVGWQVPKRTGPTITLNGTFNFAGSLGDINGVTPGAFDTQTVSNSRFYLNSGTYSPQSAYVYINTSLEISSEL